MDQKIDHLKEKKYFTPLSQEKELYPTAITILVFKFKLSAFLVWFV